MWVQGAKRRVGEGSEVRILIAGGVVVFNIPCDCLKSTPRIYLLINPPPTPHNTANDESADTEQSVEVPPAREARVAERVAAIRAANSETVAKAFAGLRKAADAKREAREGSATWNITEMSGSGSPESLRAISEDNLDNPFDATAASEEPRTLAWRAYQFDDSNDAASPPPIPTVGAGVGVNVDAVGEGDVGGGAALPLTFDARVAIIRQLYGLDARAAAGETEGTTPQQNGVSGTEARTRRPDTRHMTAERTARADYNAAVIAASNDSPGTTNPLNTFARDSIKNIKLTHPNYEIYASITFLFSLSPTQPFIPPACNSKTKAPPMKSPSHTAPSPYPPPTASAQSSAALAPRSPAAAKTSP